MAQFNGNPPFRDGLPIDPDDFEAGGSDGSLPSGINPRDLAALSLAIENARVGGHSVTLEVRSDDGTSQALEVHPNADAHAFAHRALLLAEHDRSRIAVVPQTVDGAAVAGPSAPSLPSAWFPVQKEIAVSQLFSGMLFSDMTGADPESIRTFRQLLSIVHRTQPDPAKRLELLQHFAGSYGPHSPADRIVEVLDPLLEANLSPDLNEAVRRAKARMNA